MHGRQLLGRVDQKILIPRRRPHSVMAREKLAPRCRPLGYAPVIAAFARPVGRDGAPMPPHGIASMTRENCRRSCCGTESIWRYMKRPEECRACVIADARCWLRTLARSDIDRDETIGSIHKEFRRAGLAELI